MTNNEYKTKIEMKNVLLFTLIIMITSCVQSEKKASSSEEVVLNQNEVMAGINLTVAEGKRLIAEGIANTPAVKQKMENGMIIITRGTTNTYIAERLMGLDAPHGSFMTGNITPVSRGKVDVNMVKTLDAVLINGKTVELPLDEALSQLKEGDIVFKGANLLNYEKQQAAVCIGAPDGGTTAKIHPFTGEGKAKFIIPVGLEKDCSGDLAAYEEIMCQDIPRIAYAPKLWLHKDGEIYTEIEALKTFGNVKVIPFAAGGIAGREGGISLAVYGDSTDVKNVLKVIEKIQGEEPFIK